MSLPEFTQFFWRYQPIRKLTFSSITSGGRNNLGRITSFHRGGGISRRYRIVDFRRRFIGIPASVIRFERDPFRTAPLCLLCYSNGVLSYILAPKDLLVSKRMVLSGPLSPISPANALPLYAIPLGVFIHNINGAVRSGGKKALLLRKTNKLTIMKLPSSEIRGYSFSSYATIGRLEHIKPSLKLNKAGQNRWFNKRPIVRGVAMNPIDHPHGGGEGKTSGGRPSTSPWGILTKGYKTRNPRKNFTHIFVKRNSEKDSLNS
jgi:large subunit ribosomal protein L2